MDEAIRNWEIGDSAVKRFGRIHICETPNPDKG
jgi:hypothetical protein